MEEHKELRELRDDAALDKKDSTSEEHIQNTLEGKCFARIRTVHEPMFGPFDHLHVRPRQ
jgi:hypothetical protein